MYDTWKCNQLLHSVLAEPNSAVDKGYVNELLSCYFHGLPIDTLRELLRSDTSAARRSGAFIASELGSRASVITEHIAILTSDEDAHTAYYAIECVFTCAHNQYAPYFVHVLKGLESEHEGVRVLTMGLLIDVDPPRLEGVATRVQRQANYRCHEEGLGVLLSPAIDRIAEALGAKSTLLRRYAAIAAVRRYPTAPSLLDHPAFRQSDELAELLELSSVKRRLALGSTGC